MPWLILLVAVGGVMGGFALSEGAKRLSGALLLFLILGLAFQKVNQNA